MINSRFQTTKVNWGKKSNKIHKFITQFLTRAALFQPKNLLHCDDNFVIKFIGEDGKVFLVRRWKSGKSNLFTEWEFQRAGEMDCGKINRIKN